MNRRLFKLALFLVLGAIVNVAVAWGLAWKLDVYLGPATGQSFHVARVVTEKPNHIWIVYRYERSGAMRVFSYYVMTDTTDFSSGDPDSLIPSWNQDYFSRTHLDLSNEFFRMQDGRGWPMLALWGQAATASKKSSQLYVEVEYAILLNDFTYQTQFIGISRMSQAWTKLSEARFLPLHPIWSGFAINTVFYAATLWLLTLGPFTARRMIRRKRGHCLKCGYDLRNVEHEVCPECGWQRDGVSTVECKNSVHHK